MFKVITNVIYSASVAATAGYSVFLSVHKTYPEYRSPFDEQSERDDKSERHSSLCPSPYTGFLGVPRWKFPHISEMEDVLWSLSEGTSPYDGFHGVPRWKPLHEVYIRVARSNANDTTAPYILLRDVFQIKSSTVAKAVTGGKYLKISETEEEEVVQQQQQENVGSDDSSRLSLTQNYQIIPSTNYENSAGVTEPPKSDKPEEDSIPTLKRHQDNQSSIPSLKNHQDNQSTTDYIKMMLMKVNVAEPKYLDESQDTSNSADNSEEHISKSSMDQISPESETQETKTSNEKMVGSNGDDTGDPSVQVSTEHLPSKNIVRNEIEVETNMIQSPSENSIVPNSAEQNMQVDLLPENKRIEKSSDQNTEIIPPEYIILHRAYEPEIPDMNLSKDLTEKLQSQSISTSTAQDEKPSQQEPQLETSSIFDLVEEDSSFVEQWEMFVNFVQSHYPERIRQVPYMPLCPQHLQRIKEELRIYSLARFDVGRPARRLGQNIIPPYPYQVEKTLICSSDPQPVPIYQLEDEDIWDRARAPSHFKMPSIAKVLKIYTGDIPYGLPDMPPLRKVMDYVVRYYTEEFDEPEYSRYEEMNTLSPEEIWKTKKAENSALIRQRIGVVTPTFTLLEVKRHDGGTEEPSETEVNQERVEQEVSETIPGSNDQTTPSSDDETVQESKTEATEDKEMEEREKGETNEESVMHDKNDEENVTHNAKNEESVNNNMNEESVMHDKNDEENVTDNAKSEESVNNNVNEEIVTPDANSEESVIRTGDDTNHESQNSPKEDNVAEIISRHEVDGKQTTAECDTPENVDQQTTRDRASSVLDTKSDMQTDNTVGDIVPEIISKIEETWEQQAASSNIASEKKRGMECETEASPEFGYPTREPRTNSQVNSKAARTSTDDDQYEKQFFIKKTP